MSQGIYTPRIAIAQENKNGSNGIINGNEDWNE